MKLELDRRWLERGFEPDTLTDSPFGPDVPASLAWGDVSWAVRDHRKTRAGLEAYAASLVKEVRGTLEGLRGVPVHLAVSGGYDSRILLALAEELELEPLCCGDGTQD
ncbi:MAG TPA: hypothetical protein VJW23_04795, partial [Propionibacteriaceae bacterium]|nr:hypothetical protein [Propionibacteriaceae bacterium]